MNTDLIHKYQKQYALLYFLDLNYSIEPTPKNRINQLNKQREKVDLHNKENVDP